MAYHVERCPCICQNLRQVLEVWQPHQTTNRGAHSNDGPIAFRSMRVGYHGPISSSNQTIEIPCSRHRLLHQMGGGRNPGHNHGEERTMKFCLEEHYLQVRYT